MASMQPQWDIFCRVIDNFGDIGICWRLARQLAVEHDLAVRLWVDDTASLALLCPGVDAGQDSQVAAGVEIRRWRDDVAVNRLGDVIIEAFGCGLPPTCLDSMAASSPPPCWINLEYLSAESWAEGCHGMASPHPSLPLVRYFYFPGFSPASGGLPRERGLLAARAAAQPARQSESRLEVSLFCYETAPVGELLDSLAASPRPVTCHVPPGKPLAAVSAHLGSAGPWQIGNLRVEPIAFLRAGRLRSPALALRHQFRPRRGFLRQGAMGWQAFRLAALRADGGCPSGQAGGVSRTLHGGHGR